MFDGSLKLLVSRLPDRFYFTEGEINSKFFSTSIHVKGNYFTLGELASINFRKIGQNYQKYVHI